MVFVILLEKDVLNLLIYLDFKVLCVGIATKGSIVDAGTSVSLLKPSNSIQKLFMTEAVSMAILITVSWSSHLLSSKI